MRIALNAVSKHPALGPRSLTYGTGEAVLARAETEQRPTVLGLLASGRMKPGTGTVTIDGEQDAAAIRRAIALVDAPAVSDPAPNITLAGVAAEELMFAGKPSGLLAVKRTLASLGLAQHAKDAIGQVPPAARIRLLVELALLREGVRGVVITSPDRHGGDPNAWWRIALDVASRGYAVLVIAGDASAAAIAASSLVERLETPWSVPDPDEDPTRDDSDTALIEESALLHTEGRLDLPDVITRPVPVIRAHRSEASVDAARSEDIDNAARGEDIDDAAQDTNPATADAGNRPDDGTTDPRDRESER